MIHNIMTSYDKAILAKRDELISFANSELSSITFPANDEIYKPVTNPKTNNSGLAIACGIAVLAFGLFTDKTAISICGGLIAAGGGLLLKRKSVSAPAINSIDYFAVTQQTYQVIRNINKHISEEWDNFLGKQIEKLKTEIQAMNINEETKSRMISEAISRSVFNSPASDALNKLTNFGNQKNLSAYKQYVEKLKRAYSIALNKAYDEQHIIYNKVISVQ